jgi:hypothetical protein
VILRQELSYEGAAVLGDRQVASVLKLQVEVFYIEDCDSRLGSHSGYGKPHEEAFIATIPEPATMAMLALSGLALLRRRR